MWIYMNILRSASPLVWHGPWRDNVFPTHCAQWIYDFRNGYGASMIAWDNGYNIIGIEYTGSNDGAGRPTYRVLSHNNGFSDTMDGALDMVDRMSRCM